MKSERVTVKRSTIPEKIGRNAAKRANDAYNIASGDRRARTGDKAARRSVIRPMIARAMVRKLTLGEAIHKLDFLVWLTCLSILVCINEAT